MRSHRNTINSFRVIVVVVDSHIQRILLATEKTTVTQQVSHRPIKCQSRLWSHRGTEVNGSHHGDNRYSDQQGSKSRQKVMRLYKKWHRPISKRFIKPPYSISRAASIDSDCCQQQSGQITLQLVLINKSKFLKATHRSKIRRFMVVEGLSL